MSFTGQDDERLGHVRDPSTSYNFEDHEHIYSLYLLYILTLNNELCFYLFHFPVLFHFLFFLFVQTFCHYYYLFIFSTLMSVLLLTHYLPMLKQPILHCLLLVRCTIVM